MGSSPRVIAISCVLILPGCLSNDVRTDPVLLVDAHAEHPASTDVTGERIEVEGSMPYEAAGTLRIVPPLPALGSRGPFVIPVVRSPPPSTLVFTQAVVDLTVAILDLAVAMFDFWSQK